MTPESAPAPAIIFSARWPELTSPEVWPQLAAALLAYARPRRWFRAKARRPSGARILDVVPLDAAAGTPANLLALLEIGFDGEVGAAGSEVYVVPLAHVAGGAAEAIHADQPQAIVANAPDGLLVDGLATGQAAGPLLALVREGRSARGAFGQVRGEASQALAALAAGELSWAELPRIEQTNSTLTFGGQVQLKIFRQADAGVNPELEVGRFLTESCDLPCVPRVLGALAYHPSGDGAGDGAAAPARVLGVAHEYLVNDGDAWSLARRELEAYFTRVDEAAAGGPASAAAEPASAAAEPASAPAPDGGSEIPYGRFESLADPLGRRIGELHLALAGLRRRPGVSANQEADFSAEPLSASDRAGQAARAGAMLADNLAAVRALLADLLPPARALARSLLADDGAQRAAGEVLARWRREPLTLIKTRIHGDLHLGQVLVRGDDIAIIDFEGEPSRSPAERRDKSSPLRDVMGMVRSFDYAPASLLRDRLGASAAERTRWEQAAARWTDAVSGRFLTAYRATVAGTTLLPRSPAQLSLLLTFYELERVIYELGYEINNRPEWVEVPLRGLIRVLRKAAEPAPAGGAASAG